MGLSDKTANVSKWSRKSRSSNILYTFIILFFTAGICIDFAIKQNESYDKFSIFISSALVSIGFLLLLTHHFLNTKWLYGFIIVSILCVFSIVATVFDFFSFYRVTGE